MPHDQLIGIMQASWVHIYLSYPFVLGWTLLEAMSCGCAIVGSTGMPVSEVITHGVEGLLVPINDSTALSKTISLLLTNPQLRSSLGNAARNRALNYDQRLTLPQITNLVESFHS